MFLVQIHAPAFAVLLVPGLIFGWRGTGPMLAGFGLFGVGLGLRRHFGSRAWALAGLTLAVLGAAMAAAPFGSSLYRALLFAATALIAAGAPYWRFLPPLIDADRRGIRIRGGRRHEWDAVARVDADATAIRIRLRDGTDIYVTDRELPPKHTPRVALRRIREARYHVPE